jgi:hypothetical protein
MNKPAIYTILSFLILLSGCATTKPIHFVVLNVNTHPDGAYVRSDYENYSAHVSNEYLQILTEEDLKKGKVDIPELIIEKSGYKKVFVQPAPIQIDKDFWRIKEKLFNGNFRHTYNLNEKFRLEKDPNYAGPPDPNKNKIKLTINSEPQGARIYSDGKLYGATPLTVEYKIDNHYYKTGIMRIAPLVAAHDACLPGRQNLQFIIDPDWRYQSGIVHEYATVFLLKRDPNYQPPVIVQGQAPHQGDLKVTVKKDKDALDLLQQVGEVGLLIRSLKPIR